MEAFDRKSLSFAKGAKDGAPPGFICGRDNGKPKRDPLLRSGGHDLLNAQLLVSRD